ncbi:hypothetical protein, partial [Chloroflexus sp.]|uniref:hypothetical protein n=1 Tax=Chloroflexus sp. TaxID=1904827 RepID=UPI002ACE1D6C
MRNDEQSAAPVWFVSVGFIVLVLALAALLNGVVYVRRFIDDNAYHIPMAVEIARHANPYYVDVNATFTSFWFPAGAEALVAVIVAITKDVNSTNLTGALFYILFLGLSYAFAGIWTDDRGMRLLSVALCGIIPVLFAQTEAFYVDIHINFLVYLSLYFLAFSLVKRRIDYSWYGIGVAILSASVKYHGLFFGAILVLAAIIVMVAQKSVQPSRKALIVVMICGLFTSGWYVRNLWLKGNPIYPLSLPNPLPDLLLKLGVNYQGIAFPNLSPQATFPHPLIPQSPLVHGFVPHMTDDAFGLMFPVSLLMMVLVALRSHRMPAWQRQAFWLVMGTSIAIIAVLPFHLSVPRYVMFLPAVAALWPAMLAATDLSRAFRRLASYAIVMALASLYVIANIVGIGDHQTLTKEAIALLREGRRSDIVYFDEVERGNLRIGYLSGQLAFIAALYDRHLTNQLFQLHYRDYLLD